MESTEKSILAAAILVGVVAIPAASQSLPDSDITDISNIDNSTEDPVEISTRMNSDRYVEVVESAFEKTITNTSSNRTVTVHEEPDSRLEIKETPEKKITTLETSEGLLEKMESYEKSYTKIEGPEGTLKETKINGEIRKDFEGASLEALEDRNETLHEKLGEKEFEGLETQESSIDIYVQPDNSLEGGEYVRIRNEGSEQLSLEGWSIEDTSFTPYVFGDVVLEPEESVHVYTDNPNAEYSRNRSAVWSQSGDTAFLYDDSGELVKSQSY